MSELKISKAAKYGSYRSYMEPSERCVQKIFQQAINSELDRIAGPLAEALAASLNELRRICKEPNWLIGVGSEVLENYRKERGV